MIKVTNLVRRYGDLTAINDVSFEIKKGEIVGLLGHNGAGKTTIMKVLTGFLEQCSGEVKIKGLDISEDLIAIQAKIGYLPENVPLYPEMTILDYLEYVADLRGISPEDLKAKIAKAVSRTNLESKALNKIETLSKGFKQRVGVAQAILHEPEILILDEPTNGLDPQGIHQI
ncbi:MAG: ABC transporter ATP-binding protein, partial [Candidatus Paceibacterota bacterium]